MATDPKKRQKKLEKQKAKRKAKHHAMVKEKSVGMAQQLTRAATTAPVLEALHTPDMLLRGMGQVLISREMPDGTIAVGVFLVDLYCLGVKDAFGRIISRYEYDSKFRSGGSTGRMVEMEPTTARKLVEGAVAYARSIGFQPHPDYQAARLIFGDIDASQSQEEFEYGYEGKPHFMAGPNDGPTRCRQIIATLEHTCGRGNYHFTMPIPSLGAGGPLLEDE